MVLDEETIEEAEKELQHYRAFGRSGISQDCKDAINSIKNNNDSVDEFRLYSYNARQFTDMALRLLGKYIANNTHLDRLDLDECRLTDERMALLFGGLVENISLRTLNISDNEIGIDGVRSMIPFLKSSSDSLTIYFDDNNNINTECFELLVKAVCGTSMESLSFRNCNITNISALSTYNLPNLHTLDLKGNNIGREGCVILSNMLQKEGSTLISLSLSSTGMGDVEAKILATSLKHNTKLESLQLQDNPIKERRRGIIENR